MMTLLRNKFSSGCTKINCLVYFKVTIFIYIASVLNFVHSGFIYKYIIDTYHPQSTFTCNDEAMQYREHFNQKYCHICYTFYRFGMSPADGICN